MSIFSEEEETRLREVAIARYSETKHVPFNYMIARLTYDAHVVSWLALNYWHVEVGEGGEWRLA